MRPPYRVQEYYYGMGAFHKKCIRDNVSHSNYSNENVYANKQLVILQNDDPFGETLPNTVVTRNEMISLVRNAENQKEETEQ